MKMTDLGFKYDSPGAVTASPDKAPQINYPSLHIEKDVASDKKVGEEFTTDVKFRVKSIDQSANLGHNRLLTYFYTKNLILTMAQLRLQQQKSTERYYLTV